jgi:predicted ATPase
MELLPASAEHAAAPDRRMGPPALRRYRLTRRAEACGPGGFALPGQARPCGKCPVSRAAPRHSAAARPRAGSGARGVAAPAIGGADQLGAGGAKVQPVVLAFEDLHWADPTTLDVLRGIAERGALAPLFVVATARPELRPPWGMRSHHSTISLAPLDRAQVRDMVAELSARHALPHEVVEDVAARTGGVPLFVEEVTRLLLERGEQGGIHAIPPTLQQSLMARLDRLGPAREVAQVAAVIGRGFPYGLLRAVASMGDAPLQAALEKLVDADIVLVQGLPPDSDYHFKHALIQDAAYENLLKSRRQVLHRRVAESLRDRFADSAAAEPEALAHHFTQAGMTDAAIEWWGKAGDQALRRSAFQEAISHLGKAIEMADKTGESAPRRSAETATADQRLKLQTSYGRAVMWSKGFGSEETKVAFLRVQELAAGANNPEQFAAYYGLWIGSMVRGELELARETGDTFRRKAEKEGLMPEAAAAHRCLGLTRLTQGDLTEAKGHLADALRICRPEWDHETKLRFGADTGATATAYLAHTRWLLGEVEPARALIDEAIARAVESSHVPTQSNTYYFKALLETLRGDSEAAASVAEVIVRLGRQHGLALYLAWGTVLLTWARARLGDSEAPVAALQKAVAAYIELGNKVYLPFFQGLLAEIEAEKQDVGGALARIEQALAIAGDTGDHWTDAFLHRIRGEILLRRDPANTVPAEEAFLTAIAIAQQQKAKSFELRAALLLAKLYQSTNHAADAHAMLVPALEGFSPTPEFPEIAEAQALLAALAETGEVKKEAAQRQRRLKLQTSYGQALQWSKGYVAEEATAAFKRAQELAAGTDDDAERFRIHQGQFVASYMRAELRVAQEIAETMLRGAGGKRVQEAAAAQSMLGLTLFMQGAFADASALLEEALSHHDRNANTWP